MIPVRLLLKGINSYQEEYEVDFAKLVEGQLFGIFGPVGSGKSTILEAIALALYGETERLHSNDNRNYNLMNLRSDELLIDFTFKTDLNSTLYRFTIQGKRNKKRFEQVKTFTRAAYKMEGEEWLPIAPQSAAELIGLNYKNFRRTVIIPQGKFQEFLQLKAADRTRMLKEIFALERFDLSYKVKSLAAKNRQQIERIEGSLAEYAAFNKEVLTEKNNALTKLQEELDVLAEALAKTSQLKEALEQFFAVQTRVNTATQHLTSLQTSRVAIREKIKGQQSKFEQIKKQYEGLEELKHKKADLQRLKTINYDKQQMQVNAARIVKGREVITQNEQKTKDLAKDLAGKEKQYQELKQKKPNQKALGELRVWFANKKSSVQTLQSLQERHTRIVQEIQQLSTQALAPLTDYLLSTKATIAAAQDLDPTLQLFQRKATEGKVQVQRLEKEEKKLLVDAKLGDWANNLKEDEACPLCGSVHHPQLHDAEASNIALKKLKGQLTKTKTELEEMEGLLSNFGQIKARLEEKQNQMKGLKEQKEAKEKELESLNASFTWPDFDPDDEQQLNEALQAAEQHQKQLELVEQDLDHLRKAQQKNTQNQLTYQAELNKIQEKQTRLQTEAETLINNLNILDPLEYENATEAHLKQHIYELENRIKDIEWEYKQKEQALQQLLQDESQLAGQIKTQEETVGRYKNELTDRQEHLDKAQLEALSLSHLLLEETTQEEKKTAYEAFLSTFQAQQSEQQQITERKLKLEAETERLKKDLAKKLDLEKSHAKAKERGANIQLLSNLFRGDGFVNYISSIYLQELCTAANDRFYKLTRQQLKLEINEKNEFIVRDYLNEGKTRLAKTLSGGQTFQAALSLALALAESIRIQNKANQNFFFMDEGFGSQDQEALQLVLNTLKTLRKENRVVGIISHVEELKREIAIFLSVRNDEERGSQLTNSWD